MRAAIVVNSIQETDRIYGGHSMSAPLRRVLVRRPVAPATDTDGQRFDYPRSVDHRLAVEEHAAFVRTLADHGVEVTVEDSDPVGMLDAIFSYDPSIMTDRGAILLRMGKPMREAETALHARSYERLGIPIAGRIEAPGTVEGGDTLWLDERTLAVGRGYRTNDEGIAQLTSLLGEQDVEVMPVALPHWHGPGECLHLMSLISPVAPNLAAIYPPLLPVSFIELLQSLDWRLIEVPDEEFESLGCNVLALTPDTCLMIEGNPITRERLEAAGRRVSTYRGDEISRNRAGGPTCLTRPLLRSA
ncbi:MAG TPA: arginine deiminase family protein [Thermomicrobiales bacterium]|nr:arginine deiminase family protein [Thermomicrobiales bacterium]